MEAASEKLKRTRERLGLRYRDVEEFSLQIASRRRSNEYSVTISRLSDIENRGVVPSIFKLYSLAAIYHLELDELLRWYGVDPALLPADAAGVTVGRTHLSGYGAEGLGRQRSGELQVPISLDPGLDISKTTFLSRFIQSWGVLPLMMVSGYSPKNYRYGLIGTDDWYMHPILHPGSLVLIDDTKKRIEAGGWVDEQDRPIYMLGHSSGWVCAWCHQEQERLIALPHPSVAASPMIFTDLGEVEIVGQVVGVANRLTARPRPRIPA